MAHYDQATWLASRVRRAQQLGAPQAAAAVALPGAKRAIRAQELAEHQAAGRSVHEIAAIVNEQWRAGIADRGAAFDRWRATYRDNVRLAREAAARAAAARLKESADASGQ